MFSSNQILKLSGSMDQLKYALNFALDYSDEAKNMTESERERGCKLLYQIVGKKYCIGWGFKDIPKGWSEYPFDFEVPIVSQIIIQHLRKHEKEAENNGAYDWADGSSETGFLMKSIKESLADEENGIKNPFYCIVTFEPYELFYSK